MGPQVTHTHTHSCSDRPPHVRTHTEADAQAGTHKQYKSFIFHSTQMKVTNTRFIEKNVFAFISEVRTDIASYTINAGYGIRIFGIFMQ
jgi:hypothetical protein